MLLSCRLRACLHRRGSGESVCGEWAKEGDTHVEDHVANDFVIGDKRGILFLCGEEAVDKIFLVLVLRKVRHALHESLDCVAGRDAKVVEFVEPCQMWVLAKQLVERGYLSDLRVLTGCMLTRMESTYNREIPHHILGRLQHTANIFALLHESHTLAPSHVSKEVPGKVRDPISDVTCLAAIVTLHESAFELTAKDTQILIHERLQLKSALQAV